jgi:Nitronate monooxygenase
MAEVTMVGLFSLLPAVVDVVKIPVVATGGIADARGIAAALVLGASAVQIGTGFLRCPEAKLPKAWADAMGHTPEGRKIVILKAFLIDDIEQHQPPGGSTTGGEVNVSLFAVGDCCGCPTKGTADRRQSLPPATAAGPAPTQTTA